MQYHINNEGKIYPCRARINVCKYGANQHGASKEELYAKALATNKTAAPSEKIKEVINNAVSWKFSHSYGMQCLSSAVLSDELENHPAPIEFLQATWEKIAEESRGAAPAVLTRQVFHEDVDKVNEAINNAAWCYSLGSSQEAIRDCVSMEISNAAYGRYKKMPKRKVSIERDGGSALQWLRDNKAEIAAAEEIMRNKMAKGPLKNTEEISDDYISTDYTKKAQERFLYYSKLLNTSKMISQPILEVDVTNVEAIKAKMSSMSSEDLLTIYEEYTLSDTEVANNVSELSKQYAIVNNLRYIPPGETEMLGDTPWPQWKEYQSLSDFEYRDDPTLSPKANANLKKWYNRNQIVWRKYRAEAITRISLSVFAYRELKARDERPGDNIRKDIIKSEVGMTWK